MIIDFHTHTFPEKIAAKALGKLAGLGDTTPFTNGMLPGLQSSMKDNGVDLAVLMPVATAPKQHETINRVAIGTNEKWQETGIMSFGGIHPENDNYKEIINNLANHGIKGIKLHPVFQNIDIDDEKFLRIISYACEKGLYVMTHAGYDISYPGITHASVKKIKHMLDQVAPDKMILAHMGGWSEWDEVEELLTEYPIWMDTATCLTTIVHREKDLSKRKFSPEEEQLENGRFLRIVHKLGAERFLMGSDSPWTPQGESIAVIRDNDGLTDKEKEMILGENAKSILGL